MDTDGLFILANLFEKVGDQETIPEIFDACPTIGNYYSNETLGHKHILFLLSASFHRRTN